MSVWGVATFLSLILFVAGCGSVERKRAAPPAAVAAAKQPAAAVATPAPAAEPPSHACAPHGIWRPTSSTLAKIVEGALDGGDGIARAFALRAVEDTARVRKMLGDPAAPVRLAAADELRRRRDVAGLGALRRA